MATIVRERVSHSDDGVREVELRAKPSNGGAAKLFISFPCPDGCGHEGEHCFAFDGAELLRLLKVEMGLTTLEADVDWDEQLRLLLGDRS